MYENAKNFKTPIEEHIAKIITLEFRRLEESIAFQYEMLDEQSSRADSYGDNLRYKFIRPLALKMLELLETVTECAAEYDFLDLEGEA